MQGISLSLSHTHYLSQVLLSSLFLFLIPSLLYTVLSAHGTVYVANLIQRHVVELLEHTTGGAEEEREGMTTKSEIDYWVGNE